MTYQPTAIEDDFKKLPKLPSWVTSGRAETPEDVAFLSGAALAHLHLVVARPDVPQDLLRARLALRAAEVCVTHSGRPERAADLRDAVGFLQPGDHAGPAGVVYQSWQRVIERPVSIKVIHRALPDLQPEQIATWLDGCDPRGARQGAPISRVAGVLQTALADRPRDHTEAVLLADATLAQVLGWSHVTPLLGLSFKRGDLRKSDEGLRLTCHQAMVAAVAEATRLATDLTRRASRLRAVAPKLRARGAEEAVSQLLTQDAVAPTSLTSLRSDRAARRFCDRLVDLGAVRELTGRDTFRLYGV